MEAGLRQVDVGADADLTEGIILPVQVDGVDIIVIRTDAGVRAYQGTCSHEYQRLADGFVEGHRLTCPMHFSEFDLVTGDVIAGPAGMPLASYPVEVAQGRLVLTLPADTIPVNE
jgi:nitrite reductase/ring-hydroxylating ferredoxin subunit